MSETTKYQVVTEPPEVYPRVFGQGWDVIVRPDVYPAQRAAAIALAERIARLLTEDDERIEREAMRQRCQDEGSRDDGPGANRAWVVWETACREGLPMAECRALEAAYLAAKEQDR